MDNRRTRRTSRSPIPMPMSRQIPPTRFDGEEQMLQSWIREGDLESLREWQSQGKKLPILQNAHWIIYRSPPAILVLNWLRFVGVQIDYERLAWIAVVTGDLELLNWIEFFSGIDMVITDRLRQELINSGRGEKLDWLRYNGY